MLKIAIIMVSTIIIDNNSYLAKNKMLASNEKRINNFIDGLNSLKKYLNQKVDIFLLDNSISFENLPEKLQIILKELNCIYLNNSINNLGKINKGAGIIETWKKNIDLIKKYDKIIHFEPRTIFYNDIFFKNFFSDYKNYFQIDKTGKQFYTGLFSLESKNLLKFISETNESEMVSKKISLEKIIFDFIKENNIKFKNLEKIGIIWNDSYKNINHYL